ncbi:class I SAM-dependent methyltransferase [Amycolatopsis sp. cmx-4-54]|uniref:class I SAM-dependent methyltransferase n=1 Tax=Amycolatopsis sp. cmx-4-54 TaxID=2790936 RepID=UPI00397AEDFB
MTTLDAHEYRDTYYARQFVYGMGTEQILAMLRTLPQVGSWLDLGCGSESLLWACALRAAGLTAVDLDPARLELLRVNATSAEAQGAYRTALQLGGRTQADWRSLCALVTDVRVADCLGGDAGDLPQADLVTQFGLLGLCDDERHFAERVAWMAEKTVPGGLLAGANWMSAVHPGRLRLDEELYRSAFTDAGVELTDLRRIPGSDTDYPEIWAYVGRRA